MRLSILICSLQKRLVQFARLARILGEQAEGKPVEILWLGDNKTMTVGEKRNKLLSLASGDYVCFVDDDDMVTDDYIDEILEAIEQNPDVVCFDVAFTQDGGETVISKFSKEYTFNLNHEDGNPDNTKVHVRMPNHLCPVKRELALAAGFEKKSYGEDTAYGIKLRGKTATSKLGKEVQVGKVLYNYNFSTFKSETHKFSPYCREGWPKKDPPVKMDVVMVSDGSSFSVMTQNAVNSIAGDNVNIIVVEKANITYKHADTIPQPEPFNYNRCLNKGALYGNAELICFTNNDVLFPPDFVKQVKEIFDNNKCDVISVTTNDKIYHPEIISGYCFIMKRKIWSRIGKLNTDYDFWCADNVTTEQIKKHNLKEIKTLIQVKHFVSKTLNTLSDIKREEYTRGCVKKFNKDFKQNIFNWGT